MRHRLVGLALLVVLPSVVVLAVTDDRDRSTWIAFAAASLAGVVAAWILGAIVQARPAARDHETEDEVSAFVAAVSHELRNPMATIRGFGQMLRDQPELLEGPERQHAYEVIVRQVDRMAALVDNVLDASRIDGEAFTYAFIPYNVGDLLAEAIDDARGMFPDHRMILDASGEPARATGDRDRMKQVFANLLSNACRYSDAGSEVTVRARAEGQNLVVDVIDRGAGIAPADQSHVFERFTRARTPDLDGLIGTGLGLYISRRVVEAHGGRISVDAAPGRGSTFTITVPLAPPR
jgi:signal transduction histidine kinase